MATVDAMLDTLVVSDGIGVVSNNVKILEAHISQVEGSSERIASKQQVLSAKLNTESSNLNGKIDDVVVENTVRGVVDSLCNSVMQSSLLAASEEEHRKLEEHISQVEGASERLSEKLNAESANLNGKIDDVVVDNTVRGVVDSLCNSVMQSSLLAASEEEHRKLEAHISQVEGASERIEEENRKLENHVSQVENVSRSLASQQQMLNGKLDSETRKLREKIEILDGDLVAKSSNLTSEINEKHLKAETSSETRLLGWWLCCVVYG
jgi:DNA repair exonuclease SbcCD ATPase subunit